MLKKNRVLKCTKWKNIYAWVRPNTRTTFCLRCCQIRAVWRYFTLPFQLGRGGWYWRAMTFRWELRGEQGILGVVLKKKFGQKSELSDSAETPPPSKVRHTFQKYFYCIFELYSLCLLFGD